MNVNPNKGISPNFLRKSILYLVVIAVCVVIFFTLMPQSATPAKMTMTDLTQKAKDGAYNKNIESVVISGEILTIYRSTDGKANFSSIDPNVNVSDFLSSYFIKGQYASEANLSEVIEKTNDNKAIAVTVSGNFVIVNLNTSDTDKFLYFYLNNTQAGELSDISNTVEYATYSDFYNIQNLAKQGIHNNEIASIEQSGDKINIELANGDKAESYMLADSVQLYDLFNPYGIDCSYKPPSSFSWFNLLATVLPLLLFVGFIWFIFRGARGMGNQAMNFGRSKARLFTGTKSNITFNDVAGVDEAKQELQEVVEFLKSPKKFSSLGARIPRGVLLVGAPGTGKTLLSRAVAGEAGVPFFSMSGSEFVEMFVGVGASRVRDLFEQAKRNSPCIIFIDEIDAVGRQRGAGFGGGHDEREQTLNQILVEMDGFDTSTNVIVLAATNRPDILDPALLRPGRFDRQVVLDLPDIKGRKGILKVHAKDIPLEDGVDLEVIAKQTPGFSGADLANLMNEAAILAARREKKKISLAELEESVDKVFAGPQRKSRIISPKEKEITAYHEAGHAIVAHSLPNADPVHKISIIARGMMGGYTRLLPTEDRHMWTYAQFNDTLATMLGGHTAENLTFGEVSTGASSDLQQVARISRRMVTDYGMSEKLGPRTFGRRGELIFLGREVTEEQKDYSEKTAEEIDAEVHKLVQNAQNVAREVLTNNKEKLVKLAEALIANETIEGEALEALLGKRVADLTAKPAS